MELKILSDAEMESGVGIIMNWLAGTNYWEDFERTQYGEGLCVIAIFLICRKPEYGFKRRVRHLRKENKIYMDIMLDYQKFVNLDELQRKQSILESILAEVPEVIARKKVSDFDAELFIADFKRVFLNILDNVSNARTRKSMPGL